MEITEENLMISDKVWILVAMLLRHGKSCTPSQLSNRCHVLKFTSSEITWLCKLPFSPLCLSQRGEVTFSHLALHLFEGAKAKYEEPSAAFVSWTNPLSDPVNLSTALPLVHLPAQYSSLPCKSDFDIYLRKDEDPSSESQPISTDTLCREPTRKRRKEVMFLSPNKKLKSTIVNSHVKVNDIGSEVTYSSMLSSLSGIKGKASCTLNVSMDAKKIHGAPTDLVIQRQAVALTECTSCYSQQSCTAITHCPNDSAVIGLNDLASNRQNFVHLFDKAEGKEFCAAIKCKSCFESFVRLENFMHMQSAQTCPATEIDDRVTLLTHQEHSQEPGGESGTVAERNQAKESSAAGILHNATIESSKTVLKDDAGVIGVSSHDISKKEVAACCSCKHDKIKIENGTFGGDGAEHPVPNVIKYTGKSVKQSRQKLINVKQASKLSKIRKTSSTRKQVAPAGSAVMEVCSSQPVEDNFPAFERFIVEAVEGSGGYGTVYKAVSKIDGKLFAIKYPFERTSGKHVQNEIKVLQKYGGQNFIPRCLEVIEESGRQCLVLEYIEHEKPEVLKKEISISELQCYGFSLFKALEYLHSKGVIHRDVKPGNFLFSRKKQCGWLVDFNLAMLQMKQSPSEGSKVRKLAREGISGKCEFERRINHGTKATLDKTHREVSVREQGSMSTAFSSRANMKYVEMGQEIVTPPCCTPTQDAKLHKEGTNPVSAQMWKCAEGAAKRHRKKLQTSPESAFDHTLSKFSPAKSPVTKLHLMKDTSPVSRVSRLNTSTHWSPLKEQERHLQSGERQNGDQVLPRYGRRELWELVQKTQQSPQPTVAALPSPHKKRVAAPQKRKSHKDQSFPHASTMPVSKSFVKAPIGGHLPKVRGMQKVRREGPCAGTKGYRAPEVLLKSLLQSEKIDVWSAGVSLCQLVLGKSPFLVSSSIEQSLIDIAQFCGVDAISNLAKEHNREASLPKELSPSAMQPTSVHQWCDKNTKRPELLPLVPDSLFDLLGRCLQIDPKNRISAKEALQHEFFESCRKPAS